MTKPWREKHGTWHHIISTSIGGPENVSENRYLWNAKKHAAYHQLFYNYLPSTVIAIILHWTDKDGKLKTDLMGSRNIKAWQHAFNGGSPAQVIQFIRKDFLPVEAKFLRGELEVNNETSKKKYRFRSNKKKVDSL